MDAAAVNEAAERDAALWLAAERRGGRSVAVWPEALKPADTATAYRIQARTMAAMAPDWSRRAGWKIGVTTPQMQAYLGIGSPIAAAMPGRLRRAPGAALRHVEFRRPGIECEIAMVLKAPLRAGATREAATEAIGSIHPAIEIVDDRYGDYARVGVPAIIADFAFHAGFVLGDSVPDWRRLDLAAVRGVTRANGRAVGEGRGADVMGHPLNALLWLAGLLGEQGEAIAAGSVVMTGSLPLPYWAAAGDEVEIEIEALGRVAVTFV